MSLFQAEVKTKLTEIVQLKDSVREQVEIVQQKDIGNKSSLSIKEQNFYKRGASLHNLI